MSVKLTLTYVKRTERVSAKTGKPFISLSIKAREYNDQFLSGFGNKANENWKEGDVVEVAEVREVSKDGKIYLNFEMPRYSGNGDVMKALEEIKNTLVKMKLDQAQGLKEIYEAVVSGKPKSTYPTPESEGITKMPDFSEVDDGPDQMFNEK